MRYNYRSQETDSRSVAFPIYVDRPPLDRFLNRTLRSSPYFVLALIGIVAIIRDDQQHQIFSFDWLPAVNGAVLTLLSLASVLAVAKSSIRLEYAVIWFLAGSFSVLVWPMWFVVAGGELSYLTTALVRTAVFLLLAYRGFRLSLEVRAHIVLRKKELHALMLMEDGNESRANSCSG